MSSKESGASLVEVIASGDEPAEVAQRICEHASPLLVPLATGRPAFSRVTLVGRLRLRENSRCLRAGFVVQGLSAGESAPGFVLESGKAALVGGLPNRRSAIVLIFGALPGKAFPVAQGDPVQALGAPGKSHDSCEVSESPWPATVGPGGLA